MDRCSRIAVVCLVSFLALSSATSAQSYQTGNVVQVGATRPKGNPQFDFWYLVRVDSKVYEITRHQGKNGVEDSANSAMPS
jgi:hypothetical protein